MNDSEKSATPLVDIQATPDKRNIPIDRVGVRDVRYPIVVRSCPNGTQHTVGNFTLTVDLPHHFKGTHMSRFLEVLGEQGGEISGDSIPVILDALKERLKAESAHLDVRFTYFREKAAPVTGMKGMMGYDCGFIATSGTELDFEILTAVPVTTLCPCSKEISARGAHNQRGMVTTRIRFNNFIWLEEIIDKIEACASCALFPVLKRPDEKWVTEHAYDTPRFVEDMVREVALAFNADDRITSYEIEVENFESIHAHNAYAYLARKK